MRTALLLFSLAITDLIVCHHAFSQPPQPTFTAAFTGGLNDWQISGGEWRASDGKCTARNPESGKNEFAFPILAGISGECRIEIDLTVDERLCKDGWSFAGIVLAEDEANFWLLALTESPDGVRYVDFLESCLGTWQAQGTGATAREQLHPVERGPSWRPGTPYRLTLTVNDEKVEATVTDPVSGKELAGGSYDLSKPGVAVRQGIPGLILRGTAASFSGMRVWSRTASPEKCPIPIEQGTSGNIAILRDYRMGQPSEGSRRLVADLRQAGFGVTELSAEQACNRAILSTRNIFAYVIPECQTYPPDGIEALIGFAREKGHLVFMGGPFLDNPVWCRGERWLTRQGIANAKARIKPEKLLFSNTPPDLDKWSRATADRSVAGTFQWVPEGPDGGECLKYWCKHYAKWDGYTSPTMTDFFAPGHDMLVFQAKGSEGTSQIAVELQEDDGSRWIATAAITTDWGPLALTTDEFAYWRDSPTRNTRGGAGDRLHPEKVVRINFGLADTHTLVVAPGERTFWVANLGTARNPFSEMGLTPVQVTGSLETIFPNYKVYSLEGSFALEETDSREPIRSTGRPDPIVCAIPRTMGRGFQREQKWRYIPLLDAIDRKGHRRGSPMWTLINRTLPYSGATFTGVGLGSLAFTDGVVRKKIVKQLHTLRRGLFLTEAGTEHFSYWPGEEIVAGAQVINLSEMDRYVEIVLTVTSPSGAILASNKQALTVNQRSIGTWSSVLQDIPDTAATCHVCVALLFDGAEIDRIEHDIAVLSTSVPPEDAYLQVQGNDFYLHGKKWYPVGVNFWPLYVSGMNHDDYWAGWIQRKFYDPELVEEDLVKMADLGINMVSIQSNEMVYYRNLLDFIRRCARHNILVNLYCGLASPLAFQEDKLREFVETAHLNTNPTIMAYDTIWEPGNHVFNRKTRAKWDPAWRDWLRKQYGSIEAAEKDWDYHALKDDQGRVIAPGDQCFREDGPWRVMMAAYRRFMDDLTSHMWNRAHRKLREIDPNHLISFRQGNTLPHDFVFTGTPKHIDFICPEGYAIPNNEDGYNAAGFITRYVHFTTRGKPIVWSEFGKSVWDRTSMEMSATAIETQGGYHDLFYRMTLESGANGTIPWWWPGGYRVGERSDFGIVNPDGSLRPAAELIRKYAPQLTSPREWPAPTMWFDMDRDAHPGGYWYVTFNTGRDAYREAIVAGKNLGIRTQGTSTTSANTPLIAVGNRPYNGQNPLKYLNAEFNWVRILGADGTRIDVKNGAQIKVPRGTPIRAEVCVGNTQEATWLVKSSAQSSAGIVALKTVAGSAIEGLWPITADIPYLGDADLGEITLTPGISEPTSVVLRMAVQGRAEFGEIRSFTLVPQ